MYIPLFNKHFKLSLTNILLFTVFFCLIKSIYAAPGSLDYSFGINGVSTVFINGSDLARDVLIQPDGKIIITGTSQVSGDKDFSLARLNSDGSLDNSFGTNGKVRTSFDNFDSLDSSESAVLQSDGKIILAGIYRISSGSFAALARYNSDGSLDTTFDNDGKVIVPVVGILNFIDDVAVQPDGKIVVAGTVVVNPGGSSFIAVRFNQNGTLDTSFDGDGIVVTSFTSGSQAYALAIQNNGKIILGGYTTVGLSSSFALVQYNQDGSLDTTFGNQGKVITSVSGTSTQDRIYSMAIQPDGKLVCVGTVISSGFYTSALVRYNSDGSLDTTFGVGGKVVPTIFNSDSFFSDVTFQPNGKIIVSGNARRSTIGFLVARFNSDGSPDTYFGYGGYSYTKPDSSNNSTAYATALQADGKIIAVGSGSGGFLTVRYLINGTRISDFDGDTISDVSVFRPSNGTWYLNQSQNGFAGVTFGQSGDLIAPADFDSDGKTDLAVFRPSNGAWYYTQSSNGAFVGTIFGQNGDLPRPGDFDGDGRADLAVFRPANGTWYLQQSTAGFAAVGFGSNGDKPLLADFDGDGKNDIAVFRPANATFYWLDSSTGAFKAANFGLSTDIPTMGDFDGDGKTDIAVFRPSNGAWYRTNSSDGSFFATIFGLNGDIPTAADYDGDGKADIGVFRPSNGSWYYQQSSNGGFFGQGFGIASDKPVPAAFQ